MRKRAVGVDTTLNFLRHPWNGESGRPFSRNDVTFYLDPLMEEPSLYIPHDLHESVLRNHTAPIP